MWMNKTICNGEYECAMAKNEHDHDNVNMNMHVNMEKNIKR